MLALARGEALQFQVKRNGQLIGPSVQPSIATG